MILLHYDKLLSPLPLTLFWESNRLSTVHRELENGVAPLIKENASFFPNCKQALNCPLTYSRVLFRLHIGATDGII